MVETDSITDTEWSGIQITPCMEDFVFVRLLLMFLYYFNRPAYYGSIHVSRSVNFCNDLFDNSGNW